MVQSPVKPSMKNMLADKGKDGYLPVDLVSRESKVYDCKDVSDDDFTEHQEHRAEDLCRKTMDDVR